MNRNQFKVSTPQILWHGGGSENGKPDPIYSVDFHRTENILLTSGIDSSVPPKGSVRLWKIDSSLDIHDFLIDLSDHQSAVNVARFSPCGKMIASASERQIVIYAVTNHTLWGTVTDVRDIERIWIRPNSDEIFDLNWSPDSSHLIVGAIDSKAEIIRISNRDSISLPGHSNYVQGVVWDPWNQSVVTQSSDRSCKLHKLKHSKDGMKALKLANRGHVVIKMHTGYRALDGNKILTGADFGMAEPSTTDETIIKNHGSVPTTANNQSINLFADSNVPCFFRRLCFSPDGLLLIIPTGLHKMPSNLNSPTHLAANIENLSKKSFCTHVFSRYNVSSPCLSLVGLEEPSIAVRCCPLLFKLIDHGPGAPSIPSMIPGDYRIIFAVVTIKSVLIYDTQHPHPLARISGLHLATLNDATWSADGRILVVCSSDGYLSIIRFQPGSLGRVLSDEEVPEEVKRANPALYKYITNSNNNNQCPTSMDLVDNVKRVAESQSPEQMMIDKEEPCVGTIASVKVSEKKRKRITPTLCGPILSNTFSTSNCIAMVVDHEKSTSDPNLEHSV